MAINLASDYSTLLDKRFTQKSLTDAWCGHDYNWNGVNAINVWTIGQATIGTYTASGAYRFTNGVAPTEIQDELNTYVLSKNASFGHTIDITNVQDQKNIKKANAVIKQIWDEQLLPQIEMDRLQTWAAGAGTAAIGNTLTDQTVIRAILTGGSVLNNHFVNRDSRVCFITETKAIECKLAQNLSSNDSFTTKAIINGQIAKMNGMPIVSVPDAWMPSGVELMIKYKRATVDPMKLKHMQAHVNPVGIAGTVIEGLVRYDSFVLANKAYGIYVYGTSSGVHAAPSAASQSSGTLTITADSNSTKTFYTLDGTNPKVSSTAAEYNSSSKPTGVAAGTVVKTYSTRTGYLPSGIATFTV